MSPKLLALVKWIGGADDKKYTSGIPVEWIKGFNYDEFRSDNFDPTLSYVIEWHDKPKEPPGGWPVFDGYVIEVSNRISLLEQKVRALDGFMSPTKTIMQEENEEKCDKSSKANNDKTKMSSGSDTVKQKETGDDMLTARLSSSSDNRNIRSSNNIASTKQKKMDEDIDKHESPKKIRKSCESGNRNISVTNTVGANNKKKADEDIIYEEESPHKEQQGIAFGNRTIPPSNRTAAKRQKNTDNNMNDGEESPLEAGQLSDDGKAASSISGIVPLGRNKSKTRLYAPPPEGNDGYGHTLRQIHKELKLLRKKRSRKDEVDTSDSSEEEMKEIGRKGSEIYITSQQWIVAKRARTYTAMGINLLMSLFPMKTLLQSNLRGGQSKIDKEKGGKSYKALNEKILNALYYTVNRQWKTTFNEAGLGTAINNKLTRLRSAEKKKIVEQAEQGEAD